MCLGVWQACDHPSLIVHGSTKPGDKLVPAKTRTDQVGDLCGICTDLVSSDELALAKCGHVFHHECIGSYAEEVTAQKQKPTCPTCHKPLTVTVQLHDGSDTAPKDQAQMKRQLNKLFTNKDEASPTAERPAKADVSGHDQDKDHVRRPAPARHAGAKKQKLSQVAAVADPDADEEESSDEAELARALAMSMCADDESTDEPDEDMRNAGNDSEIEDEELGLSGVAALQTAGAQKAEGASVGRSNFMSRIDVGQFKPSSKLTAVVTAIAGVKEKSKGKGKSIVFSQFVNMLDLVEWQLRKSGMNPVKLVGSMPPAQRASVLAAFKNNPKVDVVLLSLRAGGEGLNLQCATHVFLLVSATPRCFLLLPASVLLSAVLL